MIAGHKLCRITPKTVTPTFRKVQKYPEFSRIFFQFRIEKIQPNSERNSVNNLI